MGTMFATYKLDKVSRHVTPGEIVSTDEEIIQDLVPWSWWKYKILAPAGRQSSLRLLRMSKGWLSTSEYHLQVCLSYFPFTTHSLNEFPRPDFKWVVSHLAQFPKHQSLVAIRHDLLTFVLVSHENMNSFCLLYLET